MQTRSCCKISKLSKVFHLTLEKKKFKVLSLTCMIWPLAASLISFPTALFPTAIHPSLPLFQALQPPCNSSNASSISPLQASALAHLSTWNTLPPEEERLASSFNFHVCSNVTVLERSPLMTMIQHSSHSRLPCFFFFIIALKTLMLMLHFYLPQHNVSPVRAGNQFRLPKDTQTQCMAHRNNLLNE